MYAFIAKCLDSLTYFVLEKMARPCFTRADQYITNCIKLENVTPLSWYTKVWVWTILLIFIFFILVLLPFLLWEKFRDSPVALRTVDTFSSSSYNESRKPVNWKQEGF